MPRRRKPAPVRRGRPPSPDSRTIPRMIRLSPAEAASHDAARGEQPWAEWMREAAELAIARANHSLRAKHTCVKQSSSMSCRACEHGIPYPAPTLDEI